MVILVIDGSGELNKALSRGETPADMSFSVVSSGEEALERMRRVIFDVVCIESPLPREVNVVELTGVVKARSPRTGVVILSKERNMDLAMRCITAGAYDYQCISGDAAGEIYRAVRQTAAAR